MKVLCHEKEIVEYEKTIEDIKSKNNALLTSKEAEKLEKKLSKLKMKVYSSLSATTGSVIIKCAPLSFST